VPLKSGVKSHLNLSGVGATGPKSISISIRQEMMMGQQWHQLDRMQIICTSLQTDTMPVPHHSVFTGWMPFLPPNQQRQSTEGTAQYYTEQT